MSIINPNMHQRNFVGYCEGICRYYFVISDNPKLPPKACELLADVLDRIIQNTIEKFERGQIEHGGNLLERDLVKDIHDEAIDQLVYATCEQMKREMIKVSTLT